MTKWYTPEDKHGKTEENETKARKEEEEKEGAKSSNDISKEIIIRYGVGMGFHDKRNHVRTLWWYRFDRRVFGMARNTWHA